MKLSKPKILMVDDDKRILEAYKRQFRNSFLVDMADNSLEALEFLTSGQDYSVAVIDMKMPQLNGLEFIVRAKKIKQDLVCILLSGNGHLLETVSSSERALVFEFLTKPCSPYLLAKTIQSAIQSAGQKE